MLNKKEFLICVVCLVLLVNSDASTIRSSFMDNINSGLKMLGISNKIADLVSQSFAPSKTPKNKYSFRQDAIVIGDESPTLPENPFMSGMLKMLGFDGAKVGAAAVNGVIFIAQMVRYGAMKFMDYMMTKTWDWYNIVDHLSEKVRDETTNPTLPSPQRIVH